MFPTALMQFKVLSYKQSQLLIYSQILNLRPEGKILSKMLCIPNVLFMTIQGIINVKLVYILKGLTFNVEVIIMWSKLNCASMYFASFFIYFLLDTVVELHLGKIHQKPQFIKTAEY